MASTFANGKICYLEIPATDIARSADFYHHFWVESPATGRWFHRI